jgi:carbon monoxide dehydrogenase subunit G
MRFDHDAWIAAPLADLWALVDDLEALGRCIPGVTAVRVTGPNSFEADAHQRVGPIGLTFALVVRLVELAPPARAVVEIEGVDRRLAARVRQRQEMTFEPEGDGTRARIEAQVQVGGRLATFGQRVIEAKARELAEGMITNIDALVRERRGAHASAASTESGEGARGG